MHYVLETWTGHEGFTIDCQYHFPIQISVRRFLVFRGCLPSYKRDLRGKKMLRARGGKKGCFFTQLRLQDSAFGALTGVRGILVLWDNHQATGFYLSWRNWQRNPPLSNNISFEKARVCYYCDYFLDVSWWQTKTHSSSYFESMQIPVIS